MDYDRKTGGFASASEFWNATRDVFAKGASIERIEALRKAALGENVDSGGGVLVPEKWATELLTAAMETAIVRPRAFTLPMASDILNVPVLIDGSRATNIFGGVVVSYVDEGADLFASTGKPAIGSVGLKAKKSVASCFVAEELQNDAAAFFPFITEAFKRAIRFLEDDIFLWGNGVNRPLGIMESPALVTVTRKSVGKVDLADLGGLASRLAPGCWENAMWLINQSVLADWMEVTASAANAAVGLDLSTMTCLGRPIIVTEHAAALGTSGDIILADLSQYLIGDRSFIVGSARGASYSSGTYGFLQGQILWRLTMRGDGQPIVSAPYTPRRGGSTVSPFVALTTSS